MEIVVLCNSTEDSAARSHHLRQNTEMLRLQTHKLRNCVLLSLKKRSVKPRSYEGLIHRELLPALKTVYLQLRPSDLVFTKPFYTITNNG